MADVYNFPGFNTDIKSGFGDSSLAVDTGGGRIEYTVPGKPYGIFQSDKILTESERKIEALKQQNREKLARAQQKNQEGIYGKSPNLPITNDAPVSGDVVYFAGKYWQKTDLYKMIVGGLVATVVITWVLKAGKGK